jgi:hypothetical protein
MQPEELKKKIIETFHYELLEPEQQDEAVEFIIGTVIENVLPPAILALPEDDQKTVETMLEQDRELEEIFGFLTERDPQFKEAVQAELVALRDRNTELMKASGAIK